MLDYKEIIDKFISNSLDEKSFDEFKKDISTRISKTLSYYRRNITSGNLKICFDELTGDLVQEIFYVILNSNKFLGKIKHLNKEQYNKVFSSWLSTTIRNTVINFLKGKIILNKIDLNVIEPSLISTAEDEDFLSLTHGDTDVAIEVVSFDFVKGFFETLEPEEKEVLKLKYLNPELKQKDIAKELKFSEAKVSRIIEKIKEKYKEYIKKSIP